ncbi:MAG: hypothetical protein RMJ57_03105 [Bacteroidia bacterium]|nr:hypothetical protein [Bacteroidia bacterium]
MQELAMSQPELLDDVGLVWRVPEETPRLRYVLRVLCELWTHIPYKVIPAIQWDVQKVPTGWQVIDYGTPELGEAHLRLPYSGFIAQSRIDNLIPPWDEGGFFPGEGDFRWDLPAMVFYVLTLYPLYQWRYGYDEWGLYAWHRAPFYEAPFWREPFLLQRWYELLNRLEIRLPKPDFTWEIGWDIDHFYLWKGRGGLRWWLGGIRHRDLHKRLRVRWGGEKDPYDTLEMITRTFSPAHARFFFLLSDKHRRDSLVSPFHPAIKQAAQELIRQGYAVGLHPSFMSREMPELIQREKALLEEWIGISVTQSRQHYLRFWVPSTFEVLSAAGIKEDFSVAFPQRSGFLLGTTLPVPFYRVDKEKELPLLLWGPALMDRVFIDTAPQEELRKEIQRLMEVGRTVGGRLHFIWHNSTWDYLPRELFTK